MTTTRDPRRYARHARHAMAAVAAAAVATAAVAAGGLTAGATPVAAATPATEGTLDWGVKESFRNYITGPIAHGSIEVREPAARNDDGTFRFTEATGSADAEAGAADLSFAGEIYFAGHDSGDGPLLELTLTDPSVRIDGTGGVLVADVASKSLDSGELVEYPDVELGALDLSEHPLTFDGDVVSASDIPVTLTEAGAPAFADFYPAGTVLDPLSFSVTLEPAVPEWEPSIEVFASDGTTPIGDTELTDGDTVVVHGSGFDPAGNVAPEGSRPPIPAGVPAGAYVVFGKFADQWRPSQGAPSSSRAVGSQLWALADPALNQVPAEYQDTIRAQWAPIKDDGTFTAELTIAQPADRTTGEPIPWPDAGAFGIYTYAAGGTVNADQELSVPLVVDDADEPAPTPTVTVSETANLDPYGDQITVAGTGFAPGDLVGGLHVGIGVPTNDGSVPDLDPVETITPANGSFEVTLATGQVSAGTTLAVHTSPVDPGMDPAYTTQTPISFAAARAPALTVTPTDDLAVGTTVQVDGTGFAPNRRISIAFTDNTERHPTYGWPTGWLQHDVVQADADGVISRTITIAGTVTGSEVNCVDTPCFLASFSSAQASDASPVDYRADRSQDVLVPVTFAAESGAPEPAVVVEPGTVAQGETVTFHGTGFGADEDVEATIEAAPGEPSFTFDNDNGQTLTVSSGDAQPLAERDGRLLVVDGGRLDVMVAGLSATGDEGTPAGFYLLTAVDNGPGNLATPAIGGVDTTGSAGTSQWITNAPYPGSEDVVVPIVDGAAETSIGLVSADDHADCGGNRCVLYLRADHRSASNRAFDVRVPLEFVAADELVAGPVTVAGTADDDGAVTLRWPVPDNFPTGPASVTLTGASSARTASAPFTVTAADNGDGTPAPDGGSDDGGSAELVVATPARTTTTSGSPIPVRPPR